MSFFFEWLVCKCTGSREVLHHLYDFELGNKTADECRMIVDTFSEKIQDRLPEVKVKEIRVTMAYCENRKTT